MWHLVFTATGRSSELSLLKLDTSPLVMSKNAHVMGILYSIIGAYHICWRGHLLIRRWAVQTSKEEPSR